MQPISPLPHNRRRPGSPLATKTQNNIWNVEARRHARNLRRRYVADSEDDGDDDSDEDGELYVSTFSIQPPQTAISQPDGTPTLATKLGGITVTTISSVAAPSSPPISPPPTVTTLDPATPERPNLGLYPDPTSADPQLPSTRPSSTFRIPPAAISNTVTAISAAHQHPKSRPLTPKASPEFAVVIHVRRNFQPSPSSSPFTPHTNTEVQNNDRDTEEEDELSSSPGFATPPPRLCRRNLIDDEARKPRGDTDEEEDDDEEDDTDIGSLADFVVSDHTSEPARSSQSNNTEALEAEVQSGHVTPPSLPPRRLGGPRRVIFCSSNVASDDPGAVYHDGIPSDALQDLHFTN
jgi:hypothetical protein